MPTQEQFKEKHNFKILGANWFVDLTIDPDEFDEPDVLVMEVATRGVEAYFRHEHTVEDRSKGVTGFGVVIMVEHLESGLEWAIPADTILYNASQHEIAKKVTKRIRKRKGQ